ncbi:MAG: PfkB family carbohydrate kinase [Bacteroidia bacterium]|nr:PfkB family carbohydrate kinase [Bacteroidia bacterium]
MNRVIDYQEFKRILEMDVGIPVIFDPRNPEALKEQRDINDLFKSFGQLKALIIGDSMVDTYIYGRVDRISPEAPVPVVTVSGKEERPGGAANVALNIKALGARPVLCSVIGQDEAGKSFISLMKKLGLPVKGILASKQRQTTKKTRIIGNRYQLLRIDEEAALILSAAETRQFKSMIQKLMLTEKPDVIIFEDYDKGVINSEIIKYVMKIANQANIPVTVDPKKENFHHYKGVTLFKPNLKELKEGLKLDFRNFQEMLSSKQVKQFAGRQQIKNLMVTLSEHGIYYSANGKSEIIPAHVRNISDVSGAGDTVISVASLCMALNFPPASTASLANLAGGQVCEKAGVVPVDKIQLLNEAIQAGLG